MGEAEERRAQKLVLQQLRNMGLEASPLPGERAVVAEMPLRPAPFPGLEGPLEFASVRFVTVGPTQVKCLAPRALFHLPFVSIRGCTHPGMIEDRIRAAWAAQGVTLRTSRAALEQGCVASDSEADGAVLALSLGLEDPQARARLVSRQRIVLPGRGPLAGLPLERACERLFTPEPGCDAGSDLEIAVTNHLEALARHYNKRAEQRRAERAQQRGGEIQATLHTPSLLVRRHRVLVVGERLARDEAALRELRRTGCSVVTARSPQAAVEAFQSQSFDLVLADTHLDRAEGIELIPAIQSLPGVAQLPIVLVDDHMRPARREAARRVGAAGYLVQPLRVAGIARGLGRMARGVRGRRFERFPCRLAVRWNALEDGSFATAVSRQGMFVRTERLGASHRLEPFQISLPDSGRLLNAEAEILYEADEGGRDGPGLGVRLHRFAAGDEAFWIDYVGSIAQGAAAGEARP